MDVLLVLGVCVLMIVYAVQFYFTVMVWLNSSSPRPPWSPPAEVTYDPSITVPDQQLYLLQFAFDSMGGPRCCKKMWYSFRYVNSDGRFGGLGPWTSLPVFAGAKQLPCIPSHPKCDVQCVLPGGKTGPCVSVGNYSCNANRPVIGTVAELDYQVNRGDWYAVIHRQLDFLDPNSQGTPIGFLIGPRQDQTGGLYSWVDIAFSDGLDSGCVC